MSTAVRSIAWIEVGTDTDVVVTAAWADGQYTTTRTVGEHTERHGMTVADPNPETYVIDVTPAARFRTDRFHRYADQALRRFTDPSDDEEDED